MIYTDPQTAAPAFRQRLLAAQHILILSHINPDGDAIGSLLGVWHALRDAGKTVTPLASSALPGYAHWLPGASETIIYQRGMTLPDADLVLMVDTAALTRIGAIYDEHIDQLTQLPICIVDHHVTNDGHGSINLINPAAASTCELLFELLTAMQLPISAAAATCLLLGLTTDTQSFQTSSTKPNSLRIAAALLEHGADQRRIMHEVYNALPVGTAKLIALALNGLQIDQGVAWTIVTREMMQLAHAEDEAADETVRMIQRIAGIQALALFKERADQTTKISFRSHPPLNVAALAQRWGGGGHAQAAGATLLMPPSAAVTEVIPLLQALVAENMDQ
jgi:phosphoesterase RecJ-like protein